MSVTMGKRKYEFAQIAQSIL